MSDNFGIQLSINIPSGEQYEKGDMINIRGANAGEFQQNLEAFSAHMAERAAQVAADVRAQYAVVSRLGGRTVEHSQNAPQAAPQAQGGPDPQQYAQQAPQQGYQQPQGDPWGQPQGNPPGWAGSPQGGAGYPPQQQYQQQAPQQDSGGIPTSPPPHVGPAPQCSHGVKKFIAKPYKSGKPGYWMGWACPAPRGDQSQHELEFIRQS